MIVLPVVGRELRVAARRAATYRTRLWAALAAIGVVAARCFDWAWQGASTASQGRALFYALAGLAFLYCLLIGARVTSDCISEEKREGTLGLLFLTDLGGLDVVLGKLAASSINSVYGLLAVLPLLAMPLLLGGVTFEEFGKTVIALVNALFFSLSVGLLVSALSRNERKAMLGTILAVLAPALVPFCVLFFMAVILEVFQSPSELAITLPFLMANPIYSFVLSLPGSLPNFVPIPWWSFWVSVAVVHALSWLVLLVTALLLPFIWKDRGRVRVRADSVTLAERWRTWSLGEGPERQRLRTLLLERNPFLWLVSRDRLKPSYAWLFVLSMVAVWVWGYREHGDVMFDFYPLVPSLVLVHCFLKFWVVSEVSHRLVDDQRNGALELLLSTPLTVERILAGQRLALVRQFARPVIALGALELLAFRSSFPVQVILLVLIMLVADLMTLMWVAMRLSLGARSINEVLLKSFFWVLLLPWLVCLVAWPFFEIGWHFFVRPDVEMPFVHRVYFWFAVGIVNDLVLVMAWARPNLMAWTSRPGVKGLGRASNRLERLLSWRLGPEV